MSHSNLTTELPSLPLAQHRPAPSNAAIEATTDIEAVSTWLRARGQRSANTFDSYRREAARLLLWLEEMGMQLADVRVEHADKYYVFLSSPPAHWIRPRKPKKTAILMATQVLSGPLKPQSIAHSRTVLGQMFGYLQDAGYLRFNPFKLSAIPTIIEESVAKRFLDLECWEWLWDWLTQLPRTSASEVAHAVRARWLFTLLYHTGMRREEVAKGRMADFVRRDGNGELRVIGKGRKERFITVNSALLQELVIYRTALGLEYKYPTPSDAWPLVSALRQVQLRNIMTPRAIGKIVADITERAAKVCPDEHNRARIEQMSTHWLRHTSATHRMMAGASLETTQDELGHTDPKTTRIYAKAVDGARRADAEKLAKLGSL